MVVKLCIAAASIFLKSSCSVIRRVIAHDDVIGRFFDKIDSKTREFVHHPRLAKKSPILQRPSMSSASASETSAAAAINAGLGGGVF